MRKVVFVSAARTPIGKLGGALASLSAADLATTVIKAVLNRATIDPIVIDEVYLGCAIQAGQGQNVARQAAINAGLSYSIPATTINALCGSGMQAVNLAAKLIALGDAETIIAGGTESMSTAPYLIPKGRFGYRFGNAELIDAVYNDGIEDAFYHYPMGMTAENLLDKYQLTRQQIDAFALHSQERAQAAQQAGRFEAEIVPVTINTKKSKIIIKQDESIRHTSMQQLANLRPVFRHNGNVTAGNSSGLSDGAAALLLASEEYAKTMGLPILGYWEDGNLVGVKPSIMGIGPIRAVNKLLKKHQLKVKDLNLIELNEAFAAQAVVVCQELGLNDNLVNVNGGAIALGHPLGSSGARILVTLLYEMQRRGSYRGLGAICIGGGMGAATLIICP